MRAGDVGGHCLWDDLPYSPKPPRADQPIVKAFKLFLHILLGFSLLATAALMVLVTLPLVAERHEAEARYRETAEDFAEISAGLREVENTLTLLTTSLEAVEHEVRSELRMIKPGEKLVLIQREKRPAIDTTLYRDEQANGVALGH